MWLLILEALAALSVLLFMVWWTMFSGRRPDARPPEQGPEDRPPAPLATANPPAENKPDADPGRS